MLRILSRLSIGLLYDFDQINTLISVSDDTIRKLRILSRPSIGLLYDSDQMNTFIPGSDDNIRFSSVYEVDIRIFMTF